MKSKMIDMGMKRKDMYPTSEPSSKSEKDYDNEKVYPELHLDGVQAEMMGADELKAGDVVEQTVRWRVKSLTKTERDGKKSYSMTLCLEKASDCAECDSEEKPKNSTTSNAGGDSPAMAFIQGRAKDAE